MRVARCACVWVHEHLVPARSDRFDLWGVRVTRVRKHHPGMAVYPRRVQLGAGGIDHRLKQPSVRRIPCESSAVKMIWRALVATWAL